MRQELDEELFFALRRVFQQTDQLLGLLRRQRQRRNAKRSALSGMGTIRFQHGELPFYTLPGGKPRSLCAVFYAGKRRLKTLR
jgi:hypothetical protein